MGNFVGFRLRGHEQLKREAAQGLPSPHACKDAQVRVMQKIKALGEGFFAMPPGEYGDWIDALPRDEFIELVALANT